MFNYFTRVADASGIEFDYTSPLPEFEPDMCRVPAPRPERADWPVVAEPRRGFVRRPGLREAWEAWRGYVIGADEPLDRRQRRMLAAVAAEECCDRWRADDLGGHEPRDAAEERLVEFAGKLSRQPWAMQADDLDDLRNAGHGEQALLHAMSVVAMQNAESRLAIAQGAIAHAAIAQGA
jgi:hypothetical protein